MAIKPPSPPSLPGKNPTASSKNKFKSDAKGTGTYEKDITECSWRGITFPISNVHTQMDQDLVQHKYPDRDGAHVESTGRNPIVVTAKAIFYKGVSRGKGETWAFGQLFPVVFNKFVAACKDRTVGTLNHPIHGKFDAKCVSISYDLTADRRDGVIVDVQWIETIKQELQPEKLAASSASSDAAALDDALASASVIFIKQLPLDKTTSFLDTINSIKAFIDTATLIGLKVLAQINKVLYRVNSLLASIERINSVLLANLKTKANKLKASLHDMRATVSALSGKLFSTSNHLVVRDTTMGALVALLGNSVSDLIKLNMKVAAKPIIPAGTVIRYHRLVG